MEDKQISRCAVIEDDESDNVIDLEEVLYAYYYVEDYSITILFKNGQELECPFKDYNRGMEEYKKIKKHMIEYKNYVTSCNSRLLC